MQKAWWKESVVYQIYPRSFCDSNGDGIGDIQGIISKLDYLKELGIDVVWLCPVYQSPNCDNGYDISDYRDIMADFGTMADFDELLAEMHKRGLRLVMDLVVNHTSDEHAWFCESRKSEKNAYQDYYIWREGKEGEPPTNWESWFSGSAWTWCPERGMYYLHIFAEKQPDLNWKNPDVRRDVYDMMNWWCQKGIDGFRMDVISMISKADVFEDGAVLPGHQYGDLAPFVIHGPHVHEYLQEMNREVLSRYDLMTVGETAGVTVEEAKKYAGSDRHELNMVFQFELMDLDFGEKGKWADQPPKLTDIKQVISKWQTGLDGVAWNSLFWSNHDQPRIVSRFGNDTKPYRVLSAKMLGTCLHMLQGTPYIYQGEELGMTNAGFTRMDQYRDIEALNAYRDFVGGGVYDHDYMMRCLAYKSRDNARTPMQWDDSANAGFTTGTPWIEVNPNYREINAKQAVTDPDSVFHYYRKLIALRREHSIIVYGHYTLLDADNEAVFTYTREYEGQKLLCVCNFTAEAQPLALPPEFGPDAQLLIGNYPDRPDSALRPYEALVLLIEQG